MQNKTLKHFRHFRFHGIHEFTCQFKETSLEYGDLYVYDGLHPYQVSTVYIWEKDMQSYEDCLKEAIKAETEQLDQDRRVVKQQRNRLVDLEQKLIDLNQPEDKKYLVDELDTMMQLLEDE